MHEGSDIKIEHIESVEEGLKRLVLLCFQSNKQFTRVARLVVIGTQHLCRHRFSETAAASHAAIAVLCVDGSIDKRNQRSLVNILLYYDIAPSIIASVYVCTHSFSSVAGEISL